MNVTRNGKIARLSRAVRQELNRRLQDGEQGKKLVAWLNALPEVQVVVVAEWDGKPLREQNLSEWKKGGYRDFLAQQDAMEVAERLGENAMEWDAEGRPPITDTLALWIAARYTVATRTVAQTEGPEGWRLLRELCGDIIELRRGDHSAERLRMDRERLDLDRERDRVKTEGEFIVWAMENQERICQGFRTSPERMSTLVETMFGRPPQGRDESSETPKEAVSSGDAGGASGNSSAESTTDSGNSR